MPGQDGWIEAWMPLDEPAAAALDVLALGGEAEVLHPAGLRALVADIAGQIAVQHAGPGFPAGSR